MKKMKYILAIILYLCYVCATILESDFWGNILAPLVLFVAAYYIFQSKFYKEKRKSLKIGGAFLTLTIINWAVDEIIWAVIDMIMKQNPDNYYFLTILYTFSNIFLILSLFFYGFYELQRWKNLQFILNIIVISICTLIIAWVVLLNHNISNLYRVQNDLTTFYSLLIDVCIIAWTNIWFVSVKKAERSYFRVFTMLGSLIFAVADIIYYYLYTFDSYVPNTVIDAAYVSGLCLIAIGAVIKVERNEENMKSIKRRNVDKNLNVIVILLTPILLIVFDNKAIEYAFALTILSMFYFLFSAYIQKNIYKDELIFREKEINKSLEAKVLERTTELIQKNKELDQLLNIDVITGLPNRRFLYSKLKKWNLHSSNTEHIMALYIDVNHHKMIKMMYGNFISEKILSKAATQLNQFMKKHSDYLVASYSEDGFVAALKGNYEYNDGLNLANDMIQELSGLYQIEDYEIQVTLNIGVSILPYDARTEEELIKHADIATSQARMIGFNKAFAFNMQLGEKIDKKNRIELMLKTVNMDDEFELYYQPQVDAKSNEVVGFEALIRWITKNGVFISPADFISIAEEGGYIIAIGEWVLKKALETIAKWNHKANSHYRMGINVSMKQLVGNQFLNTLRAEIERNKILPEWIDIEITETIQYSENQHIIGILKEFRNMGVSVSIDDFGTGYSSFYYLNRLPMNRVKVAKELIDHIVNDNIDCHLVQSVIKVSKMREIKVIAEGVETKEQLQCLREMDCDEIQGYYFDKPLKEEEILHKYIENNIH